MKKIKLYWRNKYRQGSLRFASDVSEAHQEFQAKYAQESPSEQVVVYNDLLDRVANAHISLSRYL